jgi:O-antigen/teichoic acid export membrane protein
LKKINSGVKKITISLILRGISVVSALAISVLIGRTLGAEDLGDYNLASSILFFVVMIAKWGLDTMALKNGKGDFQKQNSILVAGVTTSTLVYAITVVFLLSFSNLFSESAHFLKILRIFLFCTLPLALVTIVSSSHKALGHTIFGNFLLEPFRFIFVLAAAGFFYLNQIVSIENLALSLLVYCLLALGLGQIGLYSKGIVKSRISFSEIKGLISKSTSFLIANSMSFLTTYTDIIMIGWMASSHDVGVYSVAARISGLFAILLVIVNSYIVPKLSVYYQEGKIRELETLAKYFTFWQGAVALPFFIAILLIPKLILGVWGEEFQNGSSILIYLSVAQFFNLLTGCVGYILTISNNEKVVRNVSMISAILNLILNFIMIKTMGFQGAAIATLISIFVQNALWTYWVHKRLKIFIFPKFPL